MPRPPIVTRFAPSPSGHLHLGHAMSALFAWRAAEEAGGRFLLRIEDIDRARCRPEFELAIYEDLAWLGLTWPRPVLRQSEDLAAYRRALDRLQDMGLLYPCFCTRRDIAEEVARAASAPHGPEGPLYPGTCRRLSPAEREERVAAGEAYALRLDALGAGKRVGSLLWHDRKLGRQAVRPDLLGDVVLARKDIATSYHLAVVWDDARQEVSLVTRGEDLIPATHVHRLLQALLGLPVPEWHHHQLIADDAGQRLAKRDAARTLRRLREDGMAPDEVRRLVGFQDANGPSPRP